MYLQITSTTVVGAGLAALVFWRWLQPRPALPTPLGLDERAPACVACGVGGYDALSAAALGTDGSTRAALKGLASVAAADFVTVRVAAAGVNYADVCLRWGLYASWNEFGGGRRPGRRCSQQHCRHRTAVRPWLSHRPTCAAGGAA